MHHLVKWLLPLAPADQDLVRGGLESDGEAEQALEGGGRRAAAIEAEHELVEVGLEGAIAEFGGWDWRRRILGDG